MNHKCNQSGVRLCLWVRSHCSWPQQLLLAWELPFSWFMYHGTTSGFFKEYSSPQKNKQTRETTKQTKTKQHLQKAVGFWSGESKPRLCQASTWTQTSSQIAPSRTTATSSAGPSCHTRRVSRVSRVSRVGRVEQAEVFLRAAMGTPTRHCIFPRFSSPFCSFAFLDFFCCWVPIPA